MMGPRAQLKLEAEKKERFEREQAAMARAARQGRRKGNAAKGRGKGRGKGGGGRAPRKGAKAPAVAAAARGPDAGNAHRARDLIVPTGELSHQPSPPPLHDVGHARGRRQGRRTSSAVLNRGEDAFGNGENWNRSAAMRAIVDWAAAANRAAGLPAGRAGTSRDDGDGGVAMLQQFDESGRLPLARR